MTPEQRRSAARTAFFTTLETPHGNAFEAGVTAAITVQITPELLATMDPAIGNREERLRAAFTAAGLEVQA